MIVTAIVLSTVSSAALMISIMTTDPFLPKHMENLDNLAQKPPSPSYLRLNRRRKRRLDVDEAVEMEVFSQDGSLR
ncbi:MAG: hypothetical protein J3Q66DRAFT_343289 [Benniella sp.]|nr:MAG: hypothetical protein J3Q66DRAFT_343289 [Benniella sp.]